MNTLSTRPLPYPPVVLEPAAQSFADILAGNPGPPLYTRSPSDARAVLDTAQAGPVAMPDAEVEHHTIPGGPTGTISIVLVRPVDRNGKLPAVIYTHGGGWVLGNFGTHERLVRDLAVQTGAAYVFVDYPPSPEARFPVAIEQIYATLQWVARHGAELGLDQECIAVAGDSVGGNMTAAVTLMAKERGGPRIRFQALLYPVTDASFETVSYREFAEGPWLTRKAMQWFWDAYLPDVSQRCMSLASPLRATLSELSGLPPALVITDEADVLRDEGEAYGRRLREAGVDVTAVRYEGVFHDFMMLNALADTNATRAAIARTARALRSALAG
ncbi:MAG TPA: alpha/beta hydrolase [Thermomicrobiales bacterium]|nr:alpha/beta hydrolase [Thermomicrobiales bacterium]